MTQIRISPKLTLIAILFALGCSKPASVKSTTPAASEPAVAYYQVDSATAGSITGKIRFTGSRPARKVIDMSSDPACVDAHQGNAYDESLVVSPNGSLGNAFVYIKSGIKSGLEGKQFAIPAQPVVIDQRGCWFRPRILGVQTGQTFQVINSDPVTHNIHPMAHTNREWNHSQGPGDPPMNRKFLQPEIMIPVKCNIHGWMHAYIGVVDNPYFAVSADDGTFAINNLPPGTYTLAVWQEKLGTQEQQITIAPHAATTASFVFKAN
jgi:plastocyanin